MSKGKKYEVIVAGGGASGMTAAIFAARNGRSTAILESNDILGKKLLATGNGKCNFTNEVQLLNCYRGGCPQAAIGLLKRYGVLEILHFFEELGIYPKQKGGYWYPNSGQAASIREVLEAEVLKCGVTVYTNCHLDQIIQQNKEFFLKANIQNREIDSVSSVRSASSMHLAEFSATYIVLATGGMAGNIKGADGSGYKIAQQLGHTIIKPVPALVQLKAKGNFLKALAGTRVEAAAHLIAEGKEYKEQGEFLFTQDGISGIPAMQLSRYASVLLYRSKNAGKIELFLDFFPGTLENDLEKELYKRFCSFPERTAQKTLTGLLPSKLNTALLCCAGMDINSRNIDINSAAEKAKKLAAIMKSFKMEIIGTNSFENAQVTAGGVSMDELNHNTMESKKVKHLYITGELADMDGTCGGYNLQWAWMTGMAAAAKIGRRAD